MNSPSDLQAEIATALDQMDIEVLRAATKLDALCVADSLDHLANRCRQLAEELPSVHAPEPHTVSNVMRSEG